MKSPGSVDSHRVSPQQLPKAAALDLRLAQLEFRLMYAPEAVRFVRVSMLILTASVHGMMPIQANP